jgi:hypothetical protein
LGHATAGARDETAHPVGVEEGGVHHQAVAPVGGGDRIATVAAEGLAQLRDIDLDGFSGGRRRRHAPELIDESLGGDELVRVQE